MRKIEALGKDHDRERFDCGSEPLNLYLRQTARQHADKGISRTYVIVDESASLPKPILGFFTLNICQIKSETLGPAESRRLPRDVAGIKLGRLAVAKQYQRQGIGKVLLVAAMAKFIEIFNVAGGIGLFVDAKDEQAKLYYEQFGFISLPSSEFELFLPVKTIQEIVKEPAE